MSDLTIPAQKEWLTAAEAAEEALPGFAFTRQHIGRLMKAGEIASRRRTAQGGGREFHWSDLPHEARREYLKRHGITSAETARPVGKAKEAQRDLKAEARHLITKAAQQFITERSLPILKGYDKFSNAYAARKTKLPAWVYDAQPDAPPHQLRRWDATIKTKGAGALLDGRGRKTGTTIFDRDDVLRVYVIAAIAANAHLSARSIAEDIERDLGRSIALRTLQNFMAGFRETHKATLKGLSHPDKHRSHHLPAFGTRSAGIERINQLWELDATRADAMCLLPDGRSVRFALTALIDVATRRAMVLVSDQPRAVATQALLRRAILAWGVPEVVKTDNGKEFAARSVELFCADAKIKLSYSRPFHPEEKPHIERFFGTLNRDLFPALPAFVGHNISDRKAIESRASFQHRFGDNAQFNLATSLSPAALQARIDAWLGDVYEYRHHEGVHFPPRDMAVALADQVVRLEDERALDTLLMPIPDNGGMRTVLKRGIRIANGFYIASELGAYMGDTVFCRHDPHDERRIAVFSRDRKTFLCTAELVDILENERRQQIAVEAQAVQRKHMRAIRDDVRKVHRLYPAATLADRRLIDSRGDFRLAPAAANAMEAAMTSALVARPSPLALAHDFAAEPVALHVTQDIGELVQCDGYARPAFIDNDLGFFDWAEARIADGDALDAQDKQIFDQLKNDEGFVLMLKTRRA